MNFRRLALAASVLAVAPSLAAQATPQALSAACCELFLTELVYYKSLGNIGVPAYTMNDGALSYAYDLEHGATFSVSDAAGATEQVVFDAADFADIDAATMDEVMMVLEEQLTLAEVFEENGMLMLRGLQGGDGAELTLSDVTAGTLAQLGFAAETMQGAEDLELALTTDLEMEEHHLAGLPYMLVVSATPGETHVAGHVLPVAIDATTLLTVRAVQLGLLPGFMGTLDEHGEADVTFDTALLPKLFPAGAPDELYFSFVVFDAAVTDLEFASNRFDAVLED